MSNGSNARGALPQAPVTVSFGERFARSEHFNAIFKEGMALVERTAAYLDGEGRREARMLKGPLTVAYAAESMRLTTRLLELASWLLIRRALRNGEITPEEAARKRTKIRLGVEGRPSHVKHFSELPSGLRGLIEKSFLLTDRIVQLDRAMIVADNGAVAADVANPVAAQIERLEVAFAGSSERLAGD
jgi:regulator of CtrA degradation